MTEDVARNVIKKLQYLKIGVSLDTCAYMYNN